MAIKYNGTTITAVKYNGTNITAVYYNGTKVWPDTITVLAQDSLTNLKGNTIFDYFIGAGYTGNTHASSAASETAKISYYTNTGFKFVNPNSATTATVTTELIGSSQVPGGIVCYNDTSNTTTTRRRTMIEDGGNYIYPADYKMNITYAMSTTSYIDSSKWMFYVTYSGLSDFGSTDSNGVFILLTKNAYDMSSISNVSVYWRFDYTWKSNSNMTIGPCIDIGFLSTKPSSYTSGNTLKFTNIVTNTIDHHANGDHTVNAIDYTENFNTSSITGTKYIAIIVTAGKNPTLRSNLINMNTTYGVIRSVILS